MELLVVVGALSAVTWKIVERIRAAIGPDSLDGTFVNIAAVAVGAGLLFLLGINNLADQALAEVGGTVGAIEIRDLPDVVNYAVGGVFLMAGAGFLQDLLNRS